MLIPVLPKNYRSIALAAIALAVEPIVLMNGKRVTDYSSNGPVTQKGIRVCRDFEVRDGVTPILGFHDHPDEMWIAAAYRELAQRCAREGWLRIQLPRQSKARPRLSRWGLTAILALLAVLPSAAATAAFSMRLADVTGAVLLLLVILSSVLAARHGTRWWLLVAIVAALWGAIVVLQVVVGE